MTELSLTVPITYHRLFLIASLHDNPVKEVLLSQFSGENLEAQGDKTTHHDRPHVKCRSQDQSSHLILKFLLLRLTLSFLSTHSRTTNCALHCASCWKYEATNILRKYHILDVPLHLN